MNDALHLRARQEFLTDAAEYFRDKKQIYLQVKDDIALEIGLPLSMIRICGSAYWGHSFTKDRPFRPTESDLDVALIDAVLYVRFLSEVREATRNFSNLTGFRGGAETPIMFQDYAYKKGIILTQLMPKTRSRRSIDAISDMVSKKYAAHFSKISFLIYDSEHSFTVKQIAATTKFRGSPQ